MLLQEHFSPVKTVPSDHFHVQYRLHSSGLLKDTKSLIKEVIRREVLQAPRSSSFRKFTAQALSLSSLIKKIPRVFRRLARNTESDTFWLISFTRVT